MAQVVEHLPNKIPCWLLYELSPAGVCLAPLLGSAAGWRWPWSREQKILRDTAGCDSKLSWWVRGRLRSAVSKCMCSVWRAVGRKRHC
jgi:hypothetical protein